MLKDAWVDVTRLWPCELRLRAVLLNTVDRHAKEVRERNTGGSSDIHVLRRNVGLQLHLVKAETLLETEQVVAQSAGFLLPVHFLRLKHLIKGLCLLNPVEGILVQVCVDLGHLVVLAAQLRKLLTSDALDGCIGSVDTQKLHEPGFVLAGELSLVQRSLGFLEELADDATLEAPESCLGRASESAGIGVSADQKTLLRLYHALLRILDSFSKY